MIMTVNPKYLEKILSQCNFVHHKSYMIWRGVEPVSLQISTKIQFLLRRVQSFSVIDQSMVFWVLFVISILIGRRDYVYIYIYALYV